MLKRMRLGAAILLCAILCACNSSVFGGRNVEELLRAPRPSEQQSAVQTALNEYLGEALQLKYPRGGVEQDPMLFSDLDGDGAEEAAVLYITESKGQDVHLAVLEQRESGWSVAYEIRGLSTEVASVELAQVMPSGVQLIVGYGNANLVDKYLAVYDYKDETLTPVCSQAYDAYVAEDMTGSGTVDIAVAAPSAERGALSLQFFTLGEEGTFASGPPVPLDERLEKCTGLYATRYGVERGFIVDGTISGGTASQLLRMEGGAFVPWPQDEEVDVSALTLRVSSLQLLKPTDFVGSGTVLVPKVGVGITTLQSAKRFYPVEWMNYLATEPMQRYGIYDVTHGYFVRLPLTWRGEITVVSSAGADEWQVRERAGNALLCTVRVVDQDVANGTYTEAARLADKKVLLYFGQACTATEANLILYGVTVLER